MLFENAIQNDWNATTNILNHCWIRSSSGKLENGAC